ncbi:RNA polymerase sigma-54 factor [Pseudomonas sp. Choline-3u-10]|mgnify:FL=1|jgi:RNA polymerase sigma-54 factor|uniref:RNA polymerase factor sigma-54 n=1 Tax=Pseudomonadaceae TaxID=135621 RepID=UPI000617CEDE|nr:MULTISPECIES: RNA polymerase factor sigma-54 [Pseudomonadaceae]MAL35140.1 RNA polymerase sigma-54 factor [Pseudomonas sp.]MBU0950110.1 RNA polymerase factor sigma-54 [Gammaproteobacteria bacterium]MBK3793389.1 RNA polymerase factor sigma-54 [Stutzerimonas stutzeri]MBK3874879.1 RNA polymerase factor sigma-54 [Stutzerimonas stutzeri]PKG90722.1 RNA polymerase sigma-54 factor [Pseudomonas sp. Choline-3u-10]
MKPSLVLKMGQQLTMTPQLQQAIRLLQLSTLDLQQEIQEALDSNPMLEREEDGDDFDNSDPMAESIEKKSESPSADSPEQSEPDNHYDEPINTVENLEEGDWGDRIPNELPVDTAWEDIYQTSASSLPSSDDDEWDFTSRTSSGESLQSHLLWQLNLAPMSDTDRLIAATLIDCINPQGYLDETLEEVLESFDPELEIELDEIEVVLRRIQQFEPAGIGARDLRECLLLQLRQLPERTEWLSEAIRLVSDHLDILGGRDYNLLMRRMKLKEDELRQIIDLIQTLNPRPGSQIEAGEPEYVVPDVIVRKHNGRWLVELNQEAMPRLRVNAQYAGFVKRADSSADNTFMRNQLQEARWFIKSLLSRNETLMKVATQIVEHQRGFFEHGDEAMKPLVLHDIAEAVGMHESTISRVTTQKFMHTPRGIYELKYFFSSHVSTAEGGECSSTAIRAIIKKLVAAENQKKPLSDSKIAGLLEEQGIQVARRTVAKYRESLGIAPSSERKRLM